MPELRRSKVGELCDAVHGGGVENLVALGSAEVRLEDPKPVIVLLLRSIGLAVLGLEEREVVIGVEEMIVAVRYDLTDQEIVGGCGLIGVNGGGCLS